MEKNELSEGSQLTLDDIYHMVASIYSEQNAKRALHSTFLHFVEVCGMLSIHARKKKQDEIIMEDVLCKALGWFFPLMAKLKVKSIEELIFRKFPNVCPYCRENVHDDSKCKTIRGTDRTVNHKAVQSKYEENIYKKPRSLNEWQNMFNCIYPRRAEDFGTGRSVIGLLEELGELAEAIRVFDSHPKYVAGEAADIFSYLMGIANEYTLIMLQSERIFDFEYEFLIRYPGLCLQCGYEICICPNVPESTVGRMSKELDLEPTDKIFSREIEKQDNYGREVGQKVFQGLGGIMAISDRIPFDRGDTNRAIILLCIRLADELTEKKPELANQLREAAKSAGTYNKKAGSKSDSSSTIELVSILRNVWHLLDLAVIPKTNSLDVMLGRVLQAEACKIGIITAIEKEFSSFRLMLDECQNFPIKGDPNQYIIGRIMTKDGTGHHLVVLTQLVQMGTNPAAVTATNLLRSFPNIQEVLMVGIAGGIPNPGKQEEHIRLGDIVISNNEGIVQFDNIKYEEGTVELRSNSSKPSARIVGIVKKLEADRLVGHYPWEMYIERGSVLENGKRPDENTDILWNWDIDPPVQIEHPTDVKRRSGMPKVHYGKIGSSNILLKNSKLRKYLSETLKVKAIEMESSGIADATWAAGAQYLAIRGICDYCDKGKNDIWQNYAAVVAAAYARAVIEEIPYFA